MMVSLLRPCMVHLLQEALSLHLESLFPCFCLAMPDKDALDPCLTTTLQLIPGTLRFSAAFS